MDRPRLDAFAGRHALGADAIGAALDLSGQRPDRETWRRFAAVLLRAAGLGAVGAGLLFFVAANWQAWGVLGRFALLQCALLACVAVALWRPAPAPVGQAALILATLLTGGLLALFGQTYQTGADLHELFFAWALLALPFALAGLSGALWAVWWGVLNVGLALLCGWLGTDHFFWRFIDGWDLARPTLLMLPCVVNLLAAGAFLGLRGTRFAAAAPVWLVRYLATFGIVYGSAATLAVVTGGAWRSDTDGLTAQGLAVILVFAGICVAIGFATWQRRRDVFPMALLGASWIAISTTMLARGLPFRDIGMLFFVAFWLIAVSTATGLLLMHWSRTWNDGAPA